MLLVSASGVNLGSGRLLLKQITGQPLLQSARETTPRWQRVSHALLTFQL